MDTRKYEDDRHAAKRITRHPVFQEMRENARKAEAALVEKVRRLEARLVDRDEEIAKLTKVLADKASEAAALAIVQRIGESAA